jgi:hypothetical protein
VVDCVGHASSSPYQAPSLLRGGTEDDGRVLWSTQGTAATTRPATASGPDKVNDVRCLNPLGGSIFFRGDDGGGNQRWSVTP